MITTRAPLRIPLGGGGTDLPSYYGVHGGFVFSVAINKYVYIQLNRLQVENCIRVKYTNTEQVDNAEKIQHPLLRESLLHTETEGGIEISAMADLPGRTGMGSSGAFTVALLNALYENKFEQISRDVLAEQANYVEAVRAAQPAGKQDHYLAAYGGLTQLVVDTDGQVTASTFDLDHDTMEELRKSMLLFYTGIERDSSDLLSQQESDTLKGDKEVIDSLHEVKRLGFEIKETLKSGQLDRFGILLHQHWMTKKLRATNMSTGLIDKWYEMGRRAGALGGKILGAGGGGFLMFYCPAEHRLHLRNTMASEGLREMSYQFDKDGAKVLMNT